ncbi:beta-1,4-galactosyltransferase 4-like isoform X3 [Mytilus galloprovincialis]|uniref:beta-1,4-galactosyltransferase 4-like isoform X3 n=1 Tax=Mytilus galloprovincialis TaxID=29158 RepID=UPI003F7BF80E
MTGLNHIDNHNSNMKPLNITSQAKSKRSDKSWYILSAGLIISVTVIFILDLQFFASTNFIRNTLNGKMLEVLSAADNFTNRFIDTMKHKLIIIDSDIPDSASEQHVTDRFSNHGNCTWPPLNLQGRTPLNRTDIPIEKLDKKYTFMADGHYKPKNCTAYQKIAIVVPYRDRQLQLRIFLNNVIPRIHRQQLEFGIYIVEQTAGSLFNRGMLSNIGFVQAMKDMAYDCVVIHDLDILPEDDRNFYICGDNPIHMATKVEKFKYRVPYHSFAGGISTFSRKQYEDINGFPNQFFGWGGEDDELFARIKRSNYKMTRPFDAHGHCGSVQHSGQRTGNDRMKMLQISRKIWKQDGLTDLEYNLVEKRRKQLYVWVYADINMAKVREKLKKLNSPSRK